MKVMSQAQHQPDRPSGFLRDRVVLITGGSRGIGKAIALRLAREGPKHLVVGYCMNREAAVETVAEIEALGVEASAYGTDVSKEDLLQGMFDHVAESFGRLDVFISNAARTSFRPALKLSSRAWRRILDLNATAFLNGSRMAAELMRQNGGGRIVGLSSLGSGFALPEYSGLGASKAAIESLARYLAVELAPLGINVNVVSGGFVDTESMRLNPEFDRLAEYLTRRTPGGRIGRPEDLAGVVAFLCSPESEWIRGQTLVADGGFSLALGEMQP
jgi:enoyl-[acyl-carrier protein] reductase III